MNTTADDLMPRVPGFYSIESQSVPLQLRHRWGSPDDPQLTGRGD